MSFYRYLDYRYNFIILVSIYGRVRRFIIFYSFFKIMNVIDLYMCGVKIWYKNVWYFYYKIVIVFIFFYWFEILKKKKRY